MRNWVKSRRNYQRRIEELVGYAYEQGKRRIDLLFLYVVTEQEKDKVLSEVRSMSLVANAYWQFEGSTVMMTVFIRS